MARGSSGDSSMMIFLVLICICLSLSTGVGAYFYNKDEDDDKSVLAEQTEEEFKKKYQDALSTLAAEREAAQQVVVAKTTLELAQEELEIARMAYEGGEFANDGERSAARQRLYVAENDVGTAGNRLIEAETKAETAAVDRNTAESNADSALANAVKEATRLEVEALGIANAALIKAESELATARSENTKIIEAAQTYATDVTTRGAADNKVLVDAAQAKLDAANLAAKAAKVRLEEAEDAAKAARIRVEEVEKALAEAEEKAAEAIITAANAAASIGICREGICPVTLKSANGLYRLEMQGDGNLVIYEGSSVVWATNIFGAGARLAMQGDGNLVVYDGNNAVLWAAGSENRGTGPYELRLQNDRNLVVYDKNNSATWASNSFVVAAPAPAPAAPAAPAPPPAFVMPSTGALTLTGGRDGKYCIDKGTGGVVCDSTNPGAFETFGIEQHGDKYILFGGNTAKYCIDKGTGGVVCDSTNAGDWEKFSIEAVGDNKYALKSNRSGKYCADEAGKILCDRDAVGGWEKFTINGSHPAAKLMGGQISWQGGGAAERGGLVWRTNRRGADWNTKYKVRCEKGGEVGPFSPEYGPVNFNTSQEGKWHNPKVRVARDGQQACAGGYKLQIFEGNENITSQMKNFDEVTTYDGTDRAFYDPRFKGGVAAAPSPSGGGGGNH